MAIVAKGGQWAITEYQVEHSRLDTQFVRLWPKTGRTHQLRVHLASQGAPILGDRLYGDLGSAVRLMLHAYRLTIPGIDGGERTFTAPPPREFTELS